MYEFFSRLFSSDFMPHGYCYLWRPGILWLNVVSDSTITLAYYFIPLALLYFVRKRRDLPFHWMFLLFGLFIFSCGTTHLMDVWTVWHGTYRLAGLIKAVTAAASVVTAALFVPLVPRALSLPSPEQLRHANVELETEIEKRRQVQAALQRAHDELESRVQRRTAELARANEQLNAEITERKLVEEALREQARLLELAHDAIIVRNLDDDITYWNSGAEEMYGWRRREAVGKPVQLLLASAYPPGVDPKAETLREGRWEGEFSQTRRNGTRIAVASRWALQRADNGAPVAILQINTDVTRQKQAVEALRESEERWRAVFENSAVGIAVIGLSGQFQSANAAYLSMVGYRLDELRELSFIDITHEEHRDETRRLFAELLAGEREFFRTEKRYRRKDGGLVWARVHDSLVPGRFVLAVAEDITEGKRAGEEVQKLALLVENSLDFIGIASLEGKAQFVNAAGCSMVGLAGSEQVPGTGILDYVAVPDRERFESAVLPAVLRDGRWEGETLFRNFETGASIPVWQHIFVVREEGSGRPLVLATISRDITERKRSEQTLQAAQTQLSHISRVTTMGELAASIAHEVNQPLAAVVTNGNACMRWLGAAEPNLDEARAAVTRIIKEGSRAANVIGRIRTLMKKSDPRMDALDVNEVIKEVLTLTGHEISRRGVALRTGLAAGLPAITGDPVQLQQVLVNLIMNAIEATAARGGGPRELLVTSEELVISKEDDTDRIVVGVRDSGVGIDSENMDRLFEPFFTTKAMGMGMGLSISRSVIERHGGRLWASPNEGVGATFRFSLPIPKAA